VLGKSIIANNRKTANRCVFDATNAVDTLGTSQTVQLIRDGRSFRAMGSDPQITLALPEEAGRSSCIRVSLGVKQPATLKIFLPAREAARRPPPLRLGGSCP
jgi:hypothetical protein